MALTKITAAIIEDGAITASALSNNSIGITQLNVSDGTSGQFLRTDGSGNLSFATVSGYTDSDVASYLSSNGYATQSTIVGAITDSAPATLDTLNELAAALGDDANFSTTVTNNIATKLPLAGGTLTGNLTGTQAFFSPNTAGKNTITITTNASDDGRILIKSDTTDKVDIQANGVTYFNGGNVGIGDTSPIAKLTVKAASDTIRAESLATDAKNITMSYHDSNDQGQIFCGQDGVVDKNIVLRGHTLIFQRNGGTEAMRIDSAGTIYQGTTTPTLHSAVTGLVLENGSLITDSTRIDGGSMTLAQNAAVDSGNTWAYLAAGEASYYQQFNGNHYFTTAASGSAGADATMATQMTIASDGTVGIGTTNPQQKLHIADGTNGTGLEIAPNDSAGKVNINSYDRGQSAWRQMDLAGSVITFATDNGGLAERMRIASDGIVYFGPNGSTADPRINRHSNGYDYINSGNSRWLKVGASSGHTNVAFQDGSSGVTIFETAGSERMRIKNTGGVQFYTDVRSNAKKMELHNGEGLWVYNNGGGNPVDYGLGSEIRLDGLSHGINATHYLALSGYLPGYTPGQYNCLKTDLNDMHFAAGGTYTGYISQNGGFTDVSDEREKENIVTISNATAKLKQLRGVYHTWKDTANRGTDTYIGLIAQEVEAVVPEVVSTSNPTSLNTPESDTVGIKGVAYAKLVPLLIETIKELEARITTLEG